MKIFRLTAITILVLSAFCCDKVATNKKVENSIKTSFIESGTIVKIMSLAEKEMEIQIHGQGKIRPAREQKIESQLNGLMISCDAYNGKSVNQDALIIVYDMRAIKLRLQKAKSNLLAARLEFDSQMLGYGSGKTLSDSSLLKIKASSGLTNVEIEMQEAELELSKSIIKAPFSGKIADIKVQQGAFVKAGSELFTIYSDKDLYMETSVLETDINLIKLNQLAKVTPVTNHDLSYSATVTEINPIVDESGMVVIRLKLQKTDGLLPGMNATAIISIPIHKTFMVPKDAIVMRTGKAVVFTMEHGRAKWNYVITGRENGNEIEIKDGLISGQKIIISNNLQLGHNARVVEEN